MKKLGFRVGMLLLILLSGEIFLRVAGWYSTYPEQNGQKYRSPYQPPQSHIYSYTPDTSFVYSCPEFSFPYQINHDGIRDQNHPEPGSLSTEYRVLFLGDSFVESQGAPQDSILTTQMAGFWRDKFPQIPARMMSGGVAGSDPWFGYILLKEQLLHLKPNLVLLSINQSDFEDFILRGNMERFLENGIVKYPNPFGNEGLYHRLHLFRFIIHEIYGLDRNFQTSTERKSRLQNAVPELTKLIRAFDQLGLEHGFSVLPVVYPLPGDMQGEGEYYFTETHLLVDSLQLRPVPFLELGPCLREKMVENGVLEDYFWKIDRHYNAKGYRVLGECIVEGLEGLNFYGESPIFP
ncbi:MAG: hypothetical protein H6581_12780 [Bacteroidia bacterium]|nr:hypothetical protein [Bacteroidia bacterium]